MTNFKKYESIKDFKSVIKEMKTLTQIEGYNEDGTPIYIKRHVKLPVIDVLCTEKIHGTNAAVGYNLANNEFWVQSRKNIITPGDDNCGCAAFVYEREEWFKNMIIELYKENKISTMNSIIVYFEFCGGNIQKLSAVSGKDKMAILFNHFKVVSVDGNEKYIEMPMVDSKDLKIYNIMDFNTYTVPVDFNNPELSQNEFVRLVEEVIEPNSPVGKKLGVDGNVGEGLVGSFYYKGQLMKFKVKGSKHSDTKVKKLKKVDSEEIMKMTEIANTVTPGWRLEQGIQEICGINFEKQELTYNLRKEFNDWVIRDIIKEEKELFSEKGIDFNDVSRYVLRITNPWFNEQINNMVIIKN